MTPEGYHAPEIQEREKMGHLEYFYRLPASDLSPTLPLLGSAVRAIGNKWKVAVFTTPQHQDLFAGLKQRLLFQDQVILLALSDNPEHIDSSYDVALLDGSAFGTRVKTLRDNLIGKTHVVTAGMDIAQDDYDLISDISIKVGMPSGVTAITGDGKGKSTTAYGYAAQAVAEGKKAAVVQWIKKREWDIAEHAFSDLLVQPDTLPFFVEGEGFYGYQPLESEHDKAKHVHAAKHGIQVAKQLLISGDYDVLVFDELVDTVQAIANNTPDDLLSLGEVRDLLEYTKSFPQTKVVVTGRQVTDAWADLVAKDITVMNKRHPYEKGIFAKRGLDF